MQAVPVAAARRNGHCLDFRNGLHPEAAGASEASAAACEYEAETLRYTGVRKAARAATVMMMPATRNTRAMPREVPSPRSGASWAEPSADRAYGMIQNWASGAMRNAVIGAAADSNAMANPNTRPWRGRGTTCWMTVCAAAPTEGN